MTAYIAAGLSTSAHKQFVIQQKGDMTDHIIKTVTDHLQIPVKDLSLKIRKREIVVARQISIYLIKERTKLSLVAIGKRFNDMDHSTVIYSIKTVNDLRDTDKAFRAQLERIEAAI